MSALILANLAPALFMTGVAWFVQVVHYPLLAAVGESRFPAYHAGHTRLTSFVVVPVMLLELFAAGVLALAPPAGLGAYAWAALALLAVVWASTFLLQVPAHGRLERGFDPASHRRLVATSWVRTLAWTARAGVLLTATAVAT